MSIETVEKDWGYGTCLRLPITAIRGIICLTFERSDHSCILPSHLAVLRFGKVCAFQVHEIIVASKVYPK